MCGIAGRVQRKPEGPPGEDLLQAMCHAMRHRGPDDEGLIIDGPAGLCMRRLKVIDVTGGHQPMCNEAGDVWLVFNGEIYNYRQLRRDLEERGHVFGSRTDTETIIHLYEEKGTDCLQDLRGMFALALWDSRNQTLVLARDRLGQKPLYYSLGSGGVTFASELTCLMCDPSVSAEVDPRAVDEYLEYLFVPHPRTIYRDVAKLPPGSFGVYRDGALTIERYWSVQYGVAETDDSTSLDRLEELLQESVALRMVADVPVGAFLSGGLDSSLIAALMQRASGGTTRTFSIGFEESSFNELKYARRVAATLGTEHKEYVVKYQVQDLIPRLVDHFGEPFADSSAIPTYHLSKMARENVTVALSGDGGDEVFGGYRRYQAGLMADVYNRWPAAAGRGILEACVVRLREPTTYYGKSIRKKIKRFVEFAAAVREGPQTSWSFFLLDEDKRSLYTEEFACQLTKDKAPASYAGYLEQRDSAPDQGMLRLDLMTYLPDDILVKVDRMSMASSLEVRSPLLDHVLVEHMASAPRQLKYGFRRSKVLLRQVAHRHLPQWVVDRPKQGFAVPLSRWLRDELRTWATDLLLSPDSRTRRFVCPQIVESMLREHGEGRRDLSQQLWSLVMLEAWLQRARSHA